MTMFARPAFDWKPLPHPTAPGRYCLARRLADGDPIQHLPGNDIASFASRALAQDRADMMRAEAEPKLALLRDCAPLLLSAAREALAALSPDASERERERVRHLLAVVVARAEGRS